MATRLIKWSNTKSYNAHYGLAQSMTPDQIYCCEKRKMEFMLITMQ